MKTYKGEKYIYLLMGYMLANKDNYIPIGEDNGIKGGQNYWRSFKVMKYQGKTILIETKTTSHSANFHRAFEVIGSLPTPTIKDYINEDGENEGQKWTH